MNFIPCRIPSIFLSLVVTLLCFVTAQAGDDWKPIDPAHLAMKASVVEKDADAEALIWEVYIDDSQADLVFNHYLRIKVFNERGVESQGKVDITYFDRWRIRDIAARTIKPDGTIVELKKDAIFDRTVIKVSGLKLKSKSFALPGVEPGSIIEYRYREVREGAYAGNLQLYFQRTIPVHLVKYYLKPSDELGSMQAYTFNGNMPGFIKEKNGFSSVQMTNVPAYREEPRMPPEDKVRTWMLVYYRRETTVNPQKYWADVGKRLYDEFKPKTKPNDEVKKMTAEVTGGAATADEKLQKILEFCRLKIRNLSSDTSGVSTEERKKLKENNNPGDTLKRGYGTDNDIDMLFAAMATAAGFEARLSLMGDRSKFFFDPSFPNTYFLAGGEIAVKVGDEWKFYDPSGKYISIGMLPWSYEGVQALIVDPKEPTWVTTPVSPADKSLEKRTAILKLSEDGTLEGDVTLEYTGHFAVEKKRYNDDDSAETREKTLHDLIIARMSTAEISRIKIENVTDQVKPFIYTFHIRVPGYAQRTGKRLFLQPSFFHQGKGAVFSSSERRYPVYFHYPWAEYDEVTINLPPGYALDNAEAPSPVTAGDISWCKVSLAMTKDGKTLVFRRNFQFGGKNGSILFPVTAYPDLKRLFDAYQEIDRHTITLKQQSATAAAEKGSNDQD